MHVTREIHSGAKAKSRFSSARIRQTTDTCLTEVQDLSPCRRSGFSDGAEPCFLWHAAHQCLPDYKSISRYHDRGRGWVRCDVTNELILHKGVRTARKQITLFVECHPDNLVWNCLSKRPTHPPTGMTPSFQQPAYSIVGEEGRAAWWSRGGGGSAMGCPRSHRCAAVARKKTFAQHGLVYV